MRAAQALSGEADLTEYLQEYRRDIKITDDAEPCSLAFDATSVSAIGVQLFVSFYRDRWGFRNERIA